VLVFFEFVNTWAGQMESPKPHQDFEAVAGLEVGINVGDIAGINGKPEYSALREPLVSKLRARVVQE
jgi:hypothetical protein